MTPASTSHVNRWFALKLSGVGRYVAVSVAFLAVSVALSLWTNTWSWLPVECWFCSACYFPPGGSFAWGRSDSTNRPNRSLSMATSST